MLGSRTDGALEEETSWPYGVCTRARAPRSFALCAPSIFLLTGWLVAGLGGCSAVTALSETRSAERALARSQRVRLTPAASYALTLGRAYLEKAREEASEAQYGQAVAYARAARHAAEDAQRTQAGSAARSEQTPSLLAGVAR